MALPHITPLFILWVQSCPSAPQTWNILEGGERGNPSRPRAGTSQGRITPSAGWTRRDMAMCRGAASLTSNVAPLLGQTPLVPRQRRAPGNCCFFLLGTITPSLWLPSISKCCGGQWWFWAGLGFFFPMLPHQGLFWLLAPLPPQRSTSEATLELEQSGNSHSCFSPAHCATGALIPPNPQPAAGKNTRTSHHDRCVLHQKPPSATATHPPHPGDLRAKGHTQPPPQITWS